MTSFTRLLATTFIAGLIATGPQAQTKGVETVVEDPVIYNEDTAKLSLGEVSRTILQDLKAENAQMKQSQLNYSTCRQRAAQQGLSDSQVQRAACEIDASYRNIGHYETLGTIFNDAAAAFYAQREKLIFTLKQQRKTRAEHQKNIDEIKTALSAKKAEFAEAFKMIDRDKITLEQRRAISVFLHSVKQSEKTILAEQEEVYHQERMIAFNEGLVVKLEDWGFSMEDAARDVDLLTMDEESIIRLINNDGIYSAATDQANGLPAVFQDLGSTFMAIKDFVNEDRDIPVRGDDDPASGKVAGQVPAAPVSDIYDEASRLLSGGPTIPAEITQ